MEKFSFERLSEEKTRKNWNCYCNGDIENNLRMILKKLIITNLIFIVDQCVILFDAFKLIIGDLENYATFN